jgi:gamma-glutamyl-gamma-aminobutyrate hydrolase PuuD
VESVVKIGISAKFHDKAPVFYGEANRSIQYLETSFASWVARNDALPFMIPSESLKSDFEPKTLNVSGYARELDALILQGGVDVHPSLYGEKPEGTGPFAYDLVRDKYELALIRAFIKARKPILGICRGLQLLNVHFGGSLFTDLEASGFQKHLDRTVQEKYTHSIDCDSKGILSQIYPEGGAVISVHHQGIKKLGEGLRIEAKSSEDALVEAVSHITDDEFVLAVQWHPEFDAVQEASTLDGDKLMRLFLEVAKTKKFGV